MLPARTDLGGLLARCTFPPAGVAGVSGGADSMAMLVLAAEAGCAVTAVHVDHGLRPGSADEADVVAALAGELGVPFRAERVVVEPGANLEARARHARRSALGPGAMTGHTADDQAETLVLQLVRGAGTSGLAAIRPGPEKPILALRRRETRSLCAERGIAVVDDPSNADPAFRRNRVRAEVLPLLDDLAAALDPTDARALAAAPVVLARRAVRRWLATERPPYPPDLATVDRVLEVARGVARATDVGGGARVLRTEGRLRIGR